MNDIVNEDPMNELLFTVDFMGGPCCSGWPLSHFMLFAVLGILYPTCGVIVNLLGILWELYEGPPVVRHEDNTVEYIGQWWQGNLRDIFFNITGFLVGKFIVLPII